MELIIPQWWIVFVPIIVFEIVWKLIALWKAARNNDLVWFVCLSVIGTVGILPIIYILMQKNKTEIQL